MNSNIRNFQNMPPLENVKSFKILELFLKFGADIKFLNKNGSSILHDLVKSNNNDTLLLLHKYGYNANFADANITSTVWHQLYRSTLDMHKSFIANTNKLDVERYYANFNIPINFKEVEEQYSHFLAYCTLKTGQIFNKCNFHLPTKIEFQSFQADVNHVTPEGLCVLIEEKQNLPIGAVVFNNKLNLAKKIADYEAFPQSNYASTNHFMHPFIHEFSHSHYFQCLYSKYGYPYPNSQYQYNPDMLPVISALATPLYDNSNGIRCFNPFVRPEIADLLRREISIYGSTNLIEALAEKLTESNISIGL